MSRYLALVTMMAMCFLGPQSVRAQEPNSQWYISGLASYVDDDKERDADDGLTGGQLALGIPFGTRWNLEIFALYNDFSADAFDADQEQMGLGLGIIRWFRQGALLQPYFGVAGGYSDTSRLVGPDESAAMASGALGLLLGFGDSAFALRGEARYRQVLEDESLSDVYLSAGLQWTLGERTARRDQRIGSDSDGDGVADSFDQCPDSKPGALVNPQGCLDADSDLDGVINRLDRCPRTPRNIPVNSRGCPTDGDRDGVIDALDACRSTPWGVGVDDKGCPLTQDADGDGVPDRIDDCPGTAAGLAVDAAGCPLPRRIELPGVRFQNNSSVLLPESTAALDRAAELLKANPQMRAEVAGHTDSVGDPAYNEWLSQRRAEAVRRYLMSRGISGERLSARGFGEAEPVADNSSAEGRAINRRVELRTSASR